MSETIQPPPRPARPQAADASLLLGEQDLYLFNEGTHSRLYEKMGAHCLPNGGVHFAVWAPNAQYVSVIGDFNDWNKSTHPMVARASSGLWELLIPEARDGSRYKFHIASKFNGYRVDKVDPFGFEHATPPLKESIVHRLDFDWQDKSWMTDRARRQTLDKPLSIFEMHLGSWMRVPEEKHRWLTYRELAPKLAQYLVDRGFTHVEFLPLMEHPFYGSWGYQTTGYFAPTSRYGSPQDLMFLIDHLHEHEIGVVLDWVPSHFPNDEHGLAYFDGTHLFEHHDMRQGFHPEWKSAIFNYGRFEVRSFLLSRYFGSKNITSIVCG
jgi:1,4-alpha-glucan branching enzyme